MKRTIAWNLDALDLRDLREHFKVEAVCAVTGLAQVKAQRWLAQVEELERRLQRDNSVARLLIAHFDANGGGPSGRAIRVSWMAGDGFICHQDYSGRPGEGLVPVTSQQAEYMALFHLLHDLRRQAAAAASVREQEWMRIRIRGDSLLVINQLNGVWKVRQPGLLPFYEAVGVELAGLRAQDRVKSVELEWIPREQNNRALRLKD